MIYYILFYLLHNKAAKTVYITCKNRLFKLSKKIKRKKWESPTVGDLLWSPTLNGTKHVKQISSHHNQDIFQEAIFYYHLSFPSPT